MDSVKKNAGLLEILIIIICLVFLELMIRTMAPLISGNVKQISEIPDTAAELTENNNAVLFLGNSLMGNALDLTEFDRLVNLNIPTYKVVPDGTTLWEWTCIIKNAFIKKRRLPKVVVIGYAWEQGRPAPSGLGGFFCSIKDLPGLVSLGMNDSSDVIDFLFSKVFRLYALRETIRKRILDILIPEYRVYTRIINTERNKNQQVKKKRKKIEDYRLLSAYMKLLVSNGIKPVIVAMPVKQHYELDEGFYRTISSYGGILLDYRDLDGIDNSMFRDPIHLNERGNKIFTYQLAVDFKVI